MAAAHIAGSRGLIYAVGPSGAGKDTVLRHWLSMLPQPSPVHWARRTITRPPAGGAAPEQHEPASEAQMERLRAQGAFALHWRANGLSYGVRHEALAALRSGQCVVVNGSRGYVGELKRLAPAARVVLVTAPAQVLARRLAQLGRESAREIEQRLRRAEEPGVDPAADYVVHNEASPMEAAAAVHAWWRISFESKVPAIPPGPAAC